MRWLLGYFEARARSRVEIIIAEGFLQTEKRGFAGAVAGSDFVEFPFIFERIDEEVELRPILDDLAARPPLETALTEDTQARLPLIFGGISVALARTFKLIDAELKAVHTGEWERTFSLFRLLI